MSKKILIIDSNQDILEIISLILQESGYLVITSKSGDIIDNVFEIQPDLILVDDWLNGSKGHELCKTLKTAPATNHIPVILTSTIDGLAQLATEYGADNYIQKPFDIDYLVEVVAVSL